MKTLCYKSVAWLMFEQCSCMIQITSVKLFSASLLSRTEKCLCIQHVCHINTDIHVYVSTMSTHQHRIHMFKFLHVCKECTEWYN
jgi:hypothetical protein